jgi:hypothetical protein
MEEHTPCDPLHNPVHALSVEFERRYLATSGQLVHLDFLEYAVDQSLVASHGTNAFVEELARTEFARLIRNGDYVRRYLIVLTTFRVVFVAGGHCDKVSSQVGTWR